MSAAAARSGRPPAAFRWGRAHFAWFACSLTDSLRGSPQVEKDSLLSKFTSGALRVLVVTDAALSALSDELCPVGHVISFDFPASMTEYAQRLSHTGRGGRTGRKTTMVTDAAPRAQVEALVHLLQSTGSEVPRWLEWMARVNPSQLSGGA